jgi:hypothetical protein
LDGSLGATAGDLTGLSSAISDRPAINATASAQKTIQRLIFISLVPCATPTPKRVWCRIDQPMPARKPIFLERAKIGNSVK